MSEATTPPAALNYATPRQFEVSQPMRSGPYLILGQNAVFPDICMRCAANASTERVSLSLPVDSVSMIVDLPISFRLVNYPALKLQMPLCPRHLRRRNSAHSSSAVAALIAIFSAITAAYFKETSPELFWLGISLAVLGLMGAILFATVFNYQPSLARFANGYYYLTGCSPEFLQQFPSTPGPTNL